MDTGEVAPLTRNAEAVRELEADTELMPPFRAGRGAGEPPDTRIGRTSQLFHIGPDKAGVERPHATKLMRITPREVVALGEEAETREVLVGQDDEAVRSLKQASVSRIALDTGARSCVATVYAVVNRLRESRRADQVFNLDVEVVRRQREPRDKARLKDYTERNRVGLFRRKGPVAAEQPIILVRRVGSNIAVLCGGHACELTLSESRGWRVDAGTGDGARIDRTRQAERGREEQLDHVRGPDRAVVCCTEADVADRGELECKLVRIGLEAVVGAGAVHFVIGITI